MARHRFHAPELTRLFESAPYPIYVLDEDLTIVFLNQACRDWLGPVAEELMGRRCVYHTGPELEATDAVAAQLCPPPVVLRGERVVADVARTIPEGMVYRRAQFVPLGASAENVLAVIALLGESDCPDPSPPDPAAEDRESFDLHEHVRRFRRQAALRYGIARLIGTSPAICRVRAQAELAAGTRASVLVIGPPGSGRRHVAESIHYGAGPEAVGSLTPLDCSLLTGELIQSTLRAAVAEVATAGQPGRNTLLLCDADQLPDESQASMAAILSAPTFRLRLIATAAAPLVEAVRHARYREDLAALLSTITIELPPLAQRRGDVPLLAQAFLEEVNALGGKQLSGFTSEALDRLAAYGWPGQVDELVKVVTESHLLAGGREVTLGDLPERLRLAADAAARPRRKEETIVLPEFLEQIERDLIRRAVARSKGNKAKAARLLGLNRARLYRRMVQLGLIEEEK